MDILGKEPYLGNQAKNDIGRSLNYFVEVITSRNVDSPMPNERVRDLVENK